MRAEKTAKLDELLANVRDAYRLIWAYQRRCLDTAQLIADQFPELSFYQWSSLLSNQPPQRGTSPFKKWTWDYLPLHSTSFLSVRNGERRYAPKAGEWMLEIRLRTDTAVVPADRIEPDPTGLEPSASSQTTMALIGWKCVKRFGKDDTWYHSVWRVSPYAEEDEREQGKAAMRCDDRVLIYEVECPMERLGTRAEIIAFVDRAKREFSTALGIEFGELDPES